MLQASNSEPLRSPCQRYALRVEGHLDPRWSPWFEGMTVTLETEGTTRIEGPVVDQCALHGLLIKVRDLHLPLVSLNRLDTPSRD